VAFGTHDDTEYEALVSGQALRSGIGRVFLVLSFWFQEKEPVFYALHSLYQMKCIYLKFFGSRLRTSYHNYTIISNTECICITFDS
jgi:hypothetical protein